MHTVSFHALAAPLVDVSVGDAPSVSEKSVTSMTSSSHTVHFAHACYAPVPPFESVGLESLAIGVVDRPMLCGKADDKTRGCMVSEDGVVCVRE